MNATLRSLILLSTGVLCSTPAGATFYLPTACPIDSQGPYNISASLQTGPKTPPPAPPSTPAERPATRTATPSDGLDTNFLEFELLGMRLRPPAGSVMRAEGTGLSATWIVSEKIDPPRFVLRITHLIASDAVSSPTKQIDAYIKSVSERPSPDAVFAVRSRSDFVLDNRPAAILYTSLREGSGDDEVSAVQGYFILQVMPNEFIVISSLLAESDFKLVSQLLERSFRTIEVADPSVLAREREQRLQRGDHLLKGLDEDALRRALDPVAKKGELPAPRWYRITRSSGNGEIQEIGYMTITVIDAAQGAANPDRKDSDWSKIEKETGLLVRVQVRTLLDITGNAVSDTDARYWMRWDRGREFWTVRSTERRGKATKTSAQLGLRSAPSAGAPRAVLEVADVFQTASATEPRRWTIPDVSYLSQAEALVLPRLMGKVDGVTEYGFYWFDAGSNRIAQRVDKQMPSADGFSVSTQSTLETPAIDQRVDPRGVLLRRSGDDGSVIEATTQSALLDLWRRKGLPTQ